MMTTARTFMTGRSQAIRLPLEYRLPDEEIIKNKVGNTNTLTPSSNMRESILHALDSFSDDYMENDQLEQTRSVPKGLL